MKEKKPIYKRKWFLIIAGILVLAIIGNMMGDDKPKEAETAPAAEVAESEAPATEARTEAPKTEAPKTEAPATEPPETEPDVPREYISALNKAQSYSDMMHMSRAGLYQQLTSEHGEQFSEEAAEYALDNLDVDYNLNALEKAKSYQDNMDMSPSAIYDQLVSEYGENFTEEQAQYAIDNLPQ